MSAKIWIVAALLKQALLEDEETAKRMREVAEHLRKCGSTTIWDVAHRGYLKRLKVDRNILPPKIEESIEWRGEESKTGKLALLGLARCQRVQCPLCSYVQTVIRRNYALEWAKNQDWSGYYGVFLTFTVSHKLPDSETVQRFKKVLERLDGSLKRYSTWFGNLTKDNRKGYKSVSPDSLGTLSSLEITFGSNGLHPHFHTMFLTKSLEDVEKLREFFRKDRVRVWKEGGGSLLRMPNENEDKSFLIFLSPQEGKDLASEKIVQYVSKGLFETLSSVTKDEQKGTSKSIFSLAGHDLKYFCTFFEATKRKRFYRAGGICKGISKLKDMPKDKEVEDEVRLQVESIIKISAEDYGVNPGLVTEFYKRNRKDFETTFPYLSASEIREKTLEKWLTFSMFKMRVMTKQNLAKKLRKSASTLSSETI
jgi:hypothetical protein